MTTLDQLVAKFQAVEKLESAVWELVRVTLLYPPDDPIVTTQLQELGELRKRVRRLDDACIEVSDE